MARWSEDSWLDLRHRIGRTRDRAAALQIISAATGYCPLPWQARAHLAGGHPDYPQDTLSKLAICGLGAGKSEFGVVEGLILALMNPGGWGMVLSPSHKQLLMTLSPRFQVYLERMARAGYPLHRRWKGSEKHWDLVCGGRIYMDSASNSDLLRGPEFAWAYMDESESLPRAASVWGTVAGRCRQPGAYVRQVYGTSTPFGLIGNVAEFHSLREKAKAMEEPERSRTLAGNYWIRATSLDNPHLPEGYIRRESQGLSKRRYDQEILALILKPESAVLPEYSADRHVRPWQYRSDHPYIMGYDPGANNPAVVWIQVVDGRYIIFDELVTDGVPQGKLHDEIVRRCNALGREPEAIGVDRARPDEIGWARRAFPRAYVHGLVTPLEQRVEYGIEIIRDLLDPHDSEPKLYLAEHLTRSPERRSTHKSLRNYRYKMRSDGTLSTDIYKDNVHDHQVDAVRMAILICLKSLKSGVFTFDRTPSVRKRTRTTYR